jgi:hypothetical protein
MPMFNHTVTYEQVAPLPSPIPQDDTMRHTVVKVVPVVRHAQSLEDTIQAWLDKGWTFKGAIDGVQSAKASSTVPDPRLVCIFTKER